MRPRSSSRSSARWPFWLLLAAWLCANSPQLAVFATLTWLHEARQFSHQQRLTAEVAFVLGGEKAPGLLAKAREQAPARAMPPIPPDAVAKKIQLSLERMVEFLPPGLRGDRRAAAEIACPEAWRAPPPHEPPRMNRVG